MIFTLVLCGLALEAFRLSVAAGAIQANLTKRKMIWLGGIFAAVQLLSLIHISEPTIQEAIAYDLFSL